MSEPWQDKAVTLAERARCIGVIEDRITYWEERNSLKTPWIAGELREVIHQIAAQPTTLSGEDT